MDLDLSRGTTGKVARKKIKIEGLEADSPDVWRKCSGHVTQTRWWQHPSELMVSPGNWSIMRTVVVTKGLFLTQTCSSQPGGVPSSRTETPESNASVWSWKELVKPVQFRAMVRLEDRCSPVQPITLKSWGRLPPGTPDLRDLQVSSAIHNKNPLLHGG